MHRHLRVYTTTIMSALDNRKVQDQILMSQVDLKTYLGMMLEFEKGRGQRYIRYLGFSHGHK